MSAVLATIAVYLGIHVFIVGLLVVVNVTERGVLPRPGRLSVSCFAREVASWAALPFLLAAGITEGQPRPSAPSADPGAPEELVPVILVPGYALNSGTLRMLAWYLRRRGWRWVWAVNNRPWSSPADRFVDRLSERVDTMLAASGARQVDIVGHSMGGALAAAYVVDRGAQDRVRRIVTLGTPWFGTKMHVWGNRRQARDLAPDSELLARARRVDVPVVGIWSESDGVVAPPDNSCPPPQGQALHLPYVGHVEMVLSARVYQAVAGALRSAPSEAALPPSAQAVMA